MFSIIVETTANTTNYMIAGFLVIFGSTLAYVISLLWRSRHLERELKDLESIDRT